MNAGLVDEIDWQMGQAVGWEQGYRTGFATGVEIGGAGLLLAIEHALPDGVLLDLLPHMPHAGEYRRLRRLREPHNRPCQAACGWCSTCIRAAAVLRNLARYGTPDYPGGPASWELPATRRGVA